MSVVELLCGPISAIVRWVCRGGGFGCSVPCASGLFVFVLVFVVGVIGTSVRCVLAAVRAVATTGNGRRLF
jgi:hypothetical protein